jgi:uncharacterized protein YbjT (DUF2867 family)
MILVVGATGVLGGGVCRRLVARGHAVRALVRDSSDPEKVEALRALGVEIAVGDLRDAGSLAGACAGVGTVFSGVTAVIPRRPDDSIAAVDDAGQRALVDAARAAGARRFVYVSYSGQIGDDCALGRAKRAVEAYLRGSGLVYTILRPSCYMETWLSPAVGFDIAGGAVRVYGSGDARLSWIAVDDVAELAALAVDAPEAENAVLELGGPVALSPNEVIAIVEAAGRELAVEYVPVEAIEAQKAAATNPTEESFAELMLGVAHGDPIPMEGVLETFPVQLTSVEEYVGRVLAERSAVQA